MRKSNFIVLLAVLVASLAEGADKDRSLYNSLPRKKGVFSEKVDNARYLEVLIVAKDRRTIVDPQRAIALGSSVYAVVYTKEPGLLYLTMERIQIDTRAFDPSERETRVMEYKLIPPSPIVSDANYQHIVPLTLGRGGFYTFTVGYFPTREAEEDIRDLLNCSDRDELRHELDELVKVGNSYSSAYVRVAGTSKVKEGTSVSVASSIAAQTANKHVFLHNTLSKDTAVEAVDDAHSLEVLVVAKDRKSILDRRGVVVPKRTEAYVVVYTVDSGIVGLTMEHVVGNPTERYPPIEVTPVLEYKLLHNAQMDAHHRYVFQVTLEHEGDYFFEAVLFEQGTDTNALGMLEDADSEAKLKYSFKHARRKFGQESDKTYVEVGGND